MKRGQIDEVARRLRDLGLDVKDVQLEHSQNGLYVTLKEGGVRVARGTWLIEYGSHEKSCAVLYLKGRCIPVGDGYTGRGWIERFCNDLARVYGAEVRPVS